MGFSGFNLILIEFNFIKCKLNAEMDPGRWTLGRGGGVEVWHRAPDSKSVKSALFRKIYCVYYFHSNILCLQMLSTTT